MGSIGMNRNIMLYWDDFPTLDILEVVQEWQNFCPEWNVVLFSKATASRFLLDNYGGEMLRLFLTCAIPAMRSDFFRVFWAISEGGLYTDVRFVPMRKPTFFDSCKDLTVAIRPNGVIKNNFFYCKKDCKELKLIAFELIQAISRKVSNEILDVSGPHLWTRMLPKKETETVAVNAWRDDVLDKFIKFSFYKSCTRGTKMHWTRLQRHMSIYCDES